MTKTQTREHPMTTDERDKIYRRLELLRERAEHASTPVGEADACRGKIISLEAKLTAAGYSTQPVSTIRRQARNYSDMMRDIFGADFVNAQREQKIREYQEYIRRNEETHNVRCQCEKCFVRRAEATCGTYSEYSEYDVKTGKSRTYKPRPKCDKCTLFEMCDECFQKQYGSPRSHSRARDTQSEAPTRRVNHKHCYAEGLHANTKEGRAWCRRNGGPA